MELGIEIAKVGRRRYVIAGVEGQHTPAILGEFAGTKKPEEHTEKTHGVVRSPSGKNVFFKRLTEKEESELSALLKKELKIRDFLEGRAKAAGHA